MGRDEMHVPRRAVALAFRNGGGFFHGPAFKYLNELLCLALLR